MSFSIYIHKIYIFLKFLLNFTLLLNVSFMTLFKLVLVNNFIYWAHSSLLLKFILPHLLWYWYCKMIILSRLLYQIIGYPHVVLPLVCLRWYLSLTVMLNVLALIASWYMCFIQFSQVSSEHCVKTDRSLLLLPARYTEQETTVFLLSLASFNLTQKEGKQKKIRNRRPHRGPLPMG